MAGERMTLVVVGAVAAVALAWVAAPWIDMARRGTVDSRTVAEWRHERHIPAPRRPSDDADSLRRIDRPARAER